MPLLHEGAGEADTGLSRRARYLLSLLHNLADDGRYLPDLPPSHGREQVQLRGEPDSSGTWFPSEQPSAGTRPPRFTADTRSTFYRTDCTTERAELERCNHATLACLTRTLSAGCS